MMHWLRSAMAVLCVLSPWAPRAAANDGDERSSGVVGRDKAVIEVSVREGFRLSEKAIARLRLRFVAVADSKEQSVPFSALVHHGAEVGVYRCRKGWFKLVDMEGFRKLDSGVLFRSSEFSSGDQIVSDGVSLLRVADLDVVAGREDRD